MSEPNEPVVVAVCRDCGGVTGIACGPFDHNATIRDWIARDDRIDAWPLKKSRENGLCQCRLREVA